MGHGGYRVALGGMAALVLAALIALAAPTAGAAADLRIEGTAGDAALTADVRAVLGDVLRVYETKVAAQPPLGAKPIVVCQAPDGEPRACLDRLPREYQINLTNLFARFYSQQVYQFGHELAHVWADPRRSNWFVESVATTMSLVSLSELAEKWETQPPRPAWKDYAKPFRAYREDTIKGHLEKLGLSSNDAVREWAKAGLVDLVREGKVGRDAQHACALLIEEALGNHPKAWGAITSLGAATTDGRTDLAKWKTLAKPEERPLVDDLAETFGPALEARPEKAAEAAKPEK